MPITIHLGKSAKLQIPIFEGTWIELPREPLQIGQRSQQLPIVSERLKDDRFVLVCEAVGGHSYDVTLHSPREATSVNDGELLPSDNADVIRLNFNGMAGEYEQREVVVRLEK